MDRILVETADGSHSLFVPELNEQYHSRHGALQESRHVFIEMGWWKVVEGKTEIRILEIGFGTGLNALLTLMEAKHAQIPVHYSAVEAFPLSEKEAKLLNYPALIGGDRVEGIWENLHSATWEQWIEVAPKFFLQKIKAKIEEFTIPEKVDLIYFDAFAPEKQPELWTIAIFQKMYDLLNPNGILVTYCAKGDVRRVMLSVGFDVQKVPGPPGKREMLVAMRN